MKMFYCYLLTTPFFVYDSAENKY